MAKNKFVSKRKKYALASIVRTLGISILGTVVAIAYIIPFFMDLTVLTEMVIKSDEAITFVFVLKSFFSSVKEHLVPLLLISFGFLIMDAYITPKLEQVYKKNDEEIEVEKEEKMVWMKEQITNQNSEVEVAKEKYRVNLLYTQKTNAEKEQQKAEKELEKRLAKMTSQERAQYEEQKKAEEEKMRLAKIAWEAEQKRQAQKNK